VRLGSNQDTISYALTYVYDDIQFFGRRIHAPPQTGRSYRGDPRAALNDRTVRGQQFSFLNSLTKNQNYGIVNPRWTKGASRADGKRPLPPRMAN
jgi:hypothetical protein